MGLFISHMPDSPSVVMAEDSGQEMGCCFSSSGDTLRGPERLFLVVVYLAS